MQRFEFSLCLRNRGGGSAKKVHDQFKASPQKIFDDNTEVYNLTKSGDIQIQHIVQGQGPRCPYRAVHAYVHFKGWLLSDMSLFNDTRAPPAPDTPDVSLCPIRITLGATGRWLDTDVEALAQAVTRMRCGGVARVAARAARAYGAGSPDGRVPFGADVLFELELLRFGQVAPPASPTHTILKQGEGKDHHPS